MIKTSVDHARILQKEINELTQWHNDYLYPPPNAQKHLNKRKRESGRIIERSFATRESERDKQIAQIKSDIQKH
jgi:hypothetical protein